MASVNDLSPIPVAQYLRMSTEHQRYSTTSQREAIEKYVCDHGMEVVKTYEDGGRSGLTLAERPALQALLQDVLSPSRRFRRIIVYDISRWGRFQDADESAYYEHLCRRSGVDVVYCAEPFGDVTGPMGVVIKSVKRVMAAEFSRELGTKVLAGQVQLSRRGFHNGGYASFGLRRVLYSESGERKCVLGPRERKAIQTDRVRLEIANPMDAALVRYIFGLFVRKRMSMASVARVLNWSGYPGRWGMHPWLTDSVRDVLRNEQYVGNLVYNRRTHSLKTPWKQNPPEEWVRAEHCFPGIVSQASFDEAQRRIDECNPHYWTKEEMIDELRVLYKKHGYVDAKLVMALGIHAKATTRFVDHFGSLADACEAAGITPSASLARRGRRIRVRRMLKIKILEELAEMYRQAGVCFAWYKHTRRACIEGGPTISVRAIQAFQQSKCRPHWILTGDPSIAPDFAVMARVSLDGPEVLDYFLYPKSEFRQGFIGQDGYAAHEWIDRYRYRTLRDVFHVLEACRRSKRCEPCLTTALSWRRRRMLGIKKHPDWHGGGAPNPFRRE